MQLARDAIASGDTVLAENYLQHAEHYNRIIITAQAAIQQQQPSGSPRVRMEGGEPALFNEAFGDSDDDEGEEAADASAVPAVAQPGQEQPRLFTEQPVRNERGEGYQPRQPREPRDGQREGFREQNGRDGQRDSPRDGQRERFGRDRFRDNGNGATAPNGNANRTSWRDDRPRDDRPRDDRPRDDRPRDERPRDDRPRDDRPRDERPREDRPRDDRPRDDRPREERRGWRDRDQPRGDFAARRPVEGGERPTEEPRGDEIRDLPMMRAERLPPREPVPSRDTEQPRLVPVEQATAPEPRLEPVQEPVRTPARVPVREREPEPVVAAPVVVIAAVAVEAAVPAEVEVRPEPKERAPRRRKVRVDPDVAVEGASEAVAVVALPDPVATE